MANRKKATFNDQERTSETLVSGGTQADAVSAKRNQADSVFRMLFNNKENLLSLYNAVNGTHYADPEELEITTLENAVFMNIKNDVSCVMYQNLSLYEQQSTVNRNMPLRDLFYVTDQLKAMTVNEDLHRSRKVLIPAPKFIVFYNGTQKQPEKVIYKLSEQFYNPTDQPALELIVEQYNINEGFNRELLKACRLLSEYMEYVRMIRYYKQKMESTAEAVTAAVDTCIEKGILRDFLLKQKGQVIAMSIYEYDEEKHIANLKQDAFEDGAASRQEEVDAANERAMAANERADTEKDRADAAEEKVRQLQAELAALKSQ